MLIGVIGAGALGLYYGARLQRAGHQVRFLLRRDLEAIAAHGLQVDSVQGSFHLDRVRGFASSAEIGPVDLVLIGLKTFANQRLVELTRPLVGASTRLLTLQNGLGNEELLAAAFDPRRVFGGVAYVCCQRGAPGTVEHLGEGKIRLGAFAGPQPESSRQLAELFEDAGVPCEAVADLVRARWEKLAWNIPFNGLSALLERDVTRLLEDPHSLSLVEEIMTEVVVAANRQGLQASIDRVPFCRALIDFSRGLDGYRPSMMLDRQAGRPLELSALFEIPLQRAAAAGVSMPATTMLHRLLCTTETP